MFGRNKTAETPAPHETTGPREGAKNRPTPKRKTQEAARKRPLVETDRKVAKETDKAKRREAQARVRQAMATGDDTYLPARDKGPVRRYIRDYIDARWNVGEFLLPVMLVVLALSFLRTFWAINLTVLLVYGLLIVAVIDAALCWRRVKGRLLEKFGDNTQTKGLVMYAVMRGFQLRRSRMPRPQVKRGEFPT